MMFLGSPLSSNPTSPIPTHSPSPLFQPDMEALDDSIPEPLPLSPVPCWAKQVLCDLARAETELHRLQERQATETEVVKRGVERAILGASREERRLLERVEQDHRDAQQHLEQVQRENAAAARVSQSLLDQRLRKLSHLQDQIQRTSQRLRQDQSGPDHSLLLQGVSELLQPWEISLSLKKVTFKPSSQPNAVSFGDIHVHEHSLRLPVGGCGPQGQLCALHSGEMQCDDVSFRTAEEERSTPDGAGPVLSLTSPTGRVVRKIRLSGHSNEDSTEELKLSSPKMRRWPPRHEHLDFESSQDNDNESATTVQQGEDSFLSVPTVHNIGDSEGEELGYKVPNKSKNYFPRSRSTPRTQLLASTREHSPSPQLRKLEHTKLGQRWSLDSQDGDRGRRRQGVSTHTYGALASPKMSPKEPLASQSCLDLTSRGRPHSRLSQSADEHPLGTPGDSGRAPSPADSLDSCYTFIVSSPRDDSVNKSSLNHNSRLSKSAADLSRRTRPLITGRKNEHGGVLKTSHRSPIFHSGSTFGSPTLSGRPRVADVVHFPSGQRGPNIEHRTHKRPTVTVARSFSMSVIDDATQESNRSREVRGEPTLVEIEEDGDSSFPLLQIGGGHLIGQFGKQGSGRSDLTLPSGVHTTPQGQVFIVDCGNARVQVTDRRGNVLQQVTSPTSDGSARRCRNYFDIAVNAKGLIALSCAAERALLVFNRHGRLLQTFGGSGSGSVRDELEAPRGVTVTRLDEFLIADIRKGTLVALKLEPKTGSRLERTVVTGFHRPYLVAACLSTGMVAVSERGSETGREPCIKVLEPGWNTVRVLGICSSMGPILACPWGICIDGDGNVLVADWGEQHKVILYPAHGVGWPIITQGLSSPRGLTLLSEGQLVVSDSMHHCIKIYQYK